MNRRVPLLVLVLVGALAAGACGEAARTADVGPSAAASDVDDPVGFARCLRAHGQNVPDPVWDQPWAPPPATTDAQRAAQAACQHFLPEIALQQQMQQQLIPTAQDLEKLRAFAVCMRAHDVPMDDPVAGLPGGGAMRIHGRFEHFSKAQWDTDPGFTAALAACKIHLPDTDPLSPNYRGPVVNKGGGQ